MGKSLGGVGRGKIVYGLPYNFDDNPWLRLDKAECKKHFAEGNEAWMLIHGACVGLRQLLRKLEPDEEAVQVRLRKAAKENAAQNKALMEAEIAAFEAGRAQTRGMVFKDGGGEERAHLAEKTLGEERAALEKAMREAD